MTVADYINKCLSVEEYSFSVNELQSEIDKSKISIKRELSRLIEKKTIINLRKGYYLIIPPRYSIQGQIPIQLYIEKLFKYLNRNYYLSFYSAAKFHGASHQQIHREYIMTKRPKLNDIKKHTIDIRFFTTSGWSNKNILIRKSDAGVFNISSPALTAVDLIHHQTKLGGLNRMLAVFEELAEELTQNDIEELLTWYPNKSTLQRFGFLLEEINADKKLSNQIKTHLEKSKFFPILLSPKTEQNPGAVDNFWKVVRNIKLESDL